QAGEQLEKYIREWVAAHPDKEVKAESFVVVHRPRRKQGRKKREASPRGLRMEELLQSSDTKNVKAVDAAQPVVEPIVKERVAEPVRSESWHAHVPIIAVVAVVLLVATNIWRLSAPSKQYTNASEEQMSRMQQSMDAMAEQIMVLNQMLKSLVEREK
ncbi:hypothetical protein IW143_003834, partial [Coemansia sp. RSA 520]